MEDYDYDDLIDRYNIDRVIEWSKVVTQPQSQYPDYQVGDEIEFISGDSNFTRKAIHFEDGYVYYTATQKIGGGLRSCGHDRIGNFRKAVTKFKVGSSYVREGLDYDYNYTCIDIEGEWAILKYTIDTKRVYAFATKTASAATNYKEVVG